MNVSLTRTKPLARKRATSRRTLSPRCSKQRCGKRAEINGLCVSHAMKRTDDLFAAWVKERDRRGPGCTYGDPSACHGPLQAAHIMPRRFYATRYDQWNVHALCARHHYLVDHNPETLKHDWAVRIVRQVNLDLLRLAALGGADRLEAITRALGWLEGYEWDA